MSKIMFSLPFFRALLATLITETVSPWRGHHTVGADKNGTPVFVHFSTQAA